ncbi:MAG TPA: hypothetical protein PKA00_06970 [Saprospiraceae bacterium]|nr:hypothetical protein [Saprospiraceae bacterium]HMQ82630.1 hypothetical protein [Saprospiraceae bacterium]
MHITIEILSEEAFSFLKSLERLNVIKLQSSPDEATAFQVEEMSASVIKEPIENYRSAYGAMNGNIQLSADWDDSLEEFKEYMG